MAYGGQSLKIYYTSKARLPKNFDYIIKLNYSKIYSIHLNYL